MKNFDEWLNDTNDVFLLKSQLRDYNNILKALEKYLIKKHGENKYRKIVQEALKGYLE